MIQKNILEVQDRATDMQLAQRKTGTTAWFPVSCPVLWNYLLKNSGPRVPSKSFGSKW